MQCTVQRIVPTPNKTPICRIYNKRQQQHPSVRIIYQECESRKRHQARSPVSKRTPQRPAYPRISIKLFLFLTFLALTDPAPPKLDGISIISSGNGGNSSIGSLSLAPLATNFGREDCEDCEVWVGCGCGGMLLVRGSKGVFGTAGMEISGEGPRIDPGRLNREFRRRRLVVDVDAVGGRSITVADIVEVGNGGAVMGVRGV